MCTLVVTPRNMRTAMQRGCIMEFYGGKIAFRVRTTINFRISNPLDKYITHAAVVCTTTVDCSLVDRLVYNMYFFIFFFLLNVTIFSRRILLCILIRDHRHRYSRSLSFSLSPSVRLYYYNNMCLVTHYGHRESARVCSVRICF